MATNAQLVSSQNKDRYIGFYGDGYVDGVGHNIAELSSFTEGRAFIKSLLDISKDYKIFLGSYFEGGALDRPLLMINRQNLKDYHKNYYFSYNYEINFTTNILKESRGDFKSSYLKNSAFIGEGIREYTLPNLTDVALFLNGILDKESNQLSYDNIRRIFDFKESSVDFDDFFIDLNSAYNKNLTRFYKKINKDQSKIYLSSKDKFDIAKFIKSYGMITYEGSFLIKDDSIILEKDLSIIKKTNNYLIDKKIELISNEKDIYLDLKDL